MRPAGLLRWIRSPGPDRVLICQEIACGGKDDKGTVAARFGDGKVRIYDSKGAGGAVVADRPVPPTALAVSPNGRTLAIGFENGKLLLRDTWNSKEQEHQVSDSAIRGLTISSAGWIAIRHEKGLRLMRARRGGGRRPQQVRGLRRAGRAGRRGRLLRERPLPGGHLGRYRRVTVWRHDGANAPQKIHESKDAKASIVALTADGRTLIRGGMDGRVSMLTLEPDAAGVGDRSWSVPANRGKVAHIDSTANHRYLLVLTDAFRAQIWDLKERTCRLLRDPRTGLAGIWNSAVFLDEDNLALTAISDAPEHAGRLVRVHHDRERGRFEFDPEFFARSHDAFKITDHHAFEGLTLLVRWDLDCRGRESRPARAGRRLEYQDRPVDPLDQRISREPSRA